jgi:hypothetical protein
MEGLRSLAILIDRGELPREAAAEMAWYCGAGFSGALRLRYAGFDPRSWIRGPVFLLSAAALLLAIMLAATRGMAVTRTLPGDSDAFVGNGVPIAFALITCILIACSGRVALRGLHWLGWAFLLLKTAAIFILCSALWVEGGFALRAHIHNETARALLGGLALAVLYVAASGCGTVWSLADQQRRCPVCLRLMTMPVRIGSWASVLEPVTTELLCDRGHGSRCLREVEMGEPDRWISLEPEFIGAGMFPLGLRNITDTSYRQ